MRKILVLVLIAALAFTLGACTGNSGNTPANDKAESTVVSTVDELMSAVNDDVTILLEPGEYNITSWIYETALKAADYENGIELGYRLYNPVYDKVLIGEVFDGYEAAFNDVSNLTVKSKDPKNPASIIIETRCAEVMHLFNCSDVTFENLSFGHTPEAGPCEEDVIQCEYSTDINIIGCDLYGCGVFGLTTVYCGDIYVKDSAIHDCEYGVADVNETDMIKFTNCEINNLGYTVLFSSHSAVIFDECNFKNIGEEFGSTYFSRVTLRNCMFDTLAQGAIDRFAEDNMDYVKISYDY